MVTSTRVNRPDIGCVVNIDRQPVEPCRSCPVRHFSICSVLEPRELQVMAEIVQTVDYPAGVTVASEGMPSEYLFSVISGTLKLYKLLADGRRQITGFLGPADFFGLAQGDTHVVSTETVTSATLCRFPRRNLETMLDSFPRLQRRLLTLASNELITAQEQMLILGRKTATEKMSSFLLSLYDRQAKRGLDSSTIPVPMGRADMADFLGLTTETVSRTLTQMKSAGTIVLEPNHRITLKDMDRLRAARDGA